MSGTCQRSPFSPAPSLEISLNEADFTRQPTFGQPAKSSDTLLKRDGCDSIAEQLTSARLSTNLATPGHKRSVSSLVVKKEKEPLVLVLRPPRSGLGIWPDGDQAWREVQDRLASVNENVLETQVRKLKEELKALKRSKEEERSERICLLSNLEDQLHSLTLENSELKRALAQTTKAKDKSAADLQNAHVALLEASAKIQRLMLEQLQLANSADETETVVNRMQREKEAAVEESLRLSSRVTSLESDLRKAYARIDELEQEKSQAYEYRQAYYREAGPPDLISNEETPRPVIAASDTDLLDLSKEQPKPTLKQLLAEARRQIVPQSLDGEICALRTKEAECKRAMEKAEGTMRGRDLTQRPGSSSSEGSEKQVEEMDKYSPDKIMMKLDRDEVKAMRDEFDEFFPSGIELPNFLWLMKCAIDVPPEEQGELVLGSYQLFHEIDINGDEHMEWAEFTQYIIDAVMGQQQRERKDDRDLSPSEVMELAESHKSRRYKLSNVADRSLHSGPIKDISYCGPLDLVMVIEEGGTAVKMYSLASKLKTQIVPMATDKHDHVVPALSKESHVLSVAFSEAENLYLVSASNRRFYLFENAAHSIRQVREFPVDAIEYQVWYFPTHRAWFSAGSDLMLKHWDVQAGKEFCRLSGHTQIVMDAVEITTPLCIATASLDGTIIMWDLEERKPIVTLNKIGVHNKGVRSVDYCADYGGNITSVGFEKNIHVWSPEVSWNQCYIGKMEGHNCPVVSCKFFQGRPVCASVDELGNVRLWDIRTLQTLQILTHDRGKLEVSKLLTIAKHDKFLVSGHRMIWFELQKESSATQSSIYDAKPLFADFNRYYMEIVIVTKADLRVYEARTGKLKRIYTDIHDQKYESEITSFCFDHRHRKFFIGDSSGGLRTYNFSNGALMKTISKVKRKEKTDVAQTHERSESKKPRYMSILEEMATSSSHLQLVESETHKSQTMDLFKSSPDDFYTEVSGLHFCSEDKMLIVSNWDSSLRIFDENDPDSSAVLRVMRGGHQGSNITAITYSPLFSLVASGASNGLVSVWDFELGKIEAALVGHTKEITCIRFLEPYPILMTSGHDFLVCFWFVRPFPGKMRYHCFYRVCMRSWGLTRDVRTAVNCFSLLTYIGPGVPREKKKTHHKQLMEQAELPGRKDAARMASFNKLKSITDKVPISAMRVQAMMEEQIAEMEVSDDDGYGDEEETEEIEENYEWVEDAGTGIIEDPETDVEVRRLYAYMADVRGNVKIWAIDNLCKQFNVQKITDSERDRQTYNPRRKDEKNAENEIKFWIKESQEFAFPAIKKPWKLLSVKEWHAHKDMILTIQTIDDPRGLLTCSADKTVRTWDWYGTLWGIIAINAPEVPTSWMFPFDWDAKRQKDIAKVTEVLNLIGEKMNFETKVVEPPAPKKPKIKKQKDPLVIKAKLPKVEKPSTAQLIESLFAKQLRNEDTGEQDEKTGDSLPRNLRGHSLNLLKRIEKFERTRRKEDNEKSTSRREEPHKGKRTQLRRTTDMNDSASSLKEIEQKTKTPGPISTKSRTKSHPRAAEIIGENTLRKIPEVSRIPSIPKPDTTAGRFEGSLHPSASLDALVRVTKPPRRPLHGFDKNSLEANRKHIEHLGKEIQSMKHAFLQ